MTTPFGGRKDYLFFNISKTDEVIKHLKQSCGPSIFFGSIPSTFKLDMSDLKIELFNFLTNG